MYTKPVKTGAELSPSRDSCLSPASQNLRYRVYIGLWLWSDHWTVIVCITAVQASSSADSDGIPSGKEKQQKSRVIYTASFEYFTIGLEHFLPAAVQSSLLYSALCIPF